jgi:hypothetical protein
MSKNLGKYAFVWVTSLAPAFCAHADNAETANKSNNPLNLAPGVNLQDYYTPRLFDTNAHTNDALLRGALPIAPNTFIDPQRTVDRKGDGLPQFTLYAGINVTFGK